MFKITTCFSVGYGFGCGMHQPYMSQHVLLQGKLNLESRVRLAGHVVWKPLALYYHLLWEESEAAMITSSSATGSSNSSGGSNSNSSVQQPAQGEHQS
jgi:hypothetical protein